LGAGTLNVYLAAIGVAGLIGLGRLFEADSVLAVFGVSIPLGLVLLTISYLLLLVVARMYFGINF
jgi:hypothetical protein